MKCLYWVFALFFFGTGMLRADIKSAQARLVEPPTKYQPGGATSYGDTFMHAWGSRPDANGNQTNPLTYVDYVTTNDGTAWNTACPNQQNVMVSFFSNATALTGPTIANCMTDLGQLGLDNGNPAIGDKKTWKSAGMLVLNGVLYLTIIRQQEGGSFLADHASILKSTNGGRSWCFTTPSDCNSASNNGVPPDLAHAEFCDASSGQCSTNFVNIHFVQYERDGVTDSTNKDEQNTYIYAMASDSMRANYYLMRIPRTSNLQLGTAWQYYIGATGGSVTTSSNWAGFGTSGANRPASCSGDSHPDCGATIIFNNGVAPDGTTIKGSNGGLIWTGNDFGYLLASGNANRYLYLSQNLTGDTGGKWRRIIYAPPSFVPAGAPKHENPVTDDFPEPVLSTLSVTNAGQSNTTATLVLSSSGDYTNSDRGQADNNYAMFTTQLTLYKAAQTQNYDCTPATNLPGTPKWVSYFGDDTYSSAGAYAPISDQSPGHLASVPVPASTHYVTLGLGFSVPPSPAPPGVLNTPYTDNTQDFTLYVVYNRSTLANTGFAYERIADKSDGSGGQDGFAIQRENTDPSKWCVYIGGSTGNCISSTSSLPDNQTNMVAIRRLTSGSTSRLVMWSSDTSSTAPLVSVDASGVAGTAANSTTLRVGNSAALSNPFQGSIAAVVYYSNGLSDADAAVAQRAIEDKMYCSARGVTLPGVTGNQ